MIFYFSLGILIFTLGASAFGRRFLFDRLRNACPPETSCPPASSPRLPTPCNGGQVAGEVGRAPSGDGRRANLVRCCEATPRRGIYEFIFWGSVVWIFILLFYQSFLQHKAWSQNELSRYLLPPYRPIFYFIFYVGTRFFAPYIVSFSAAFLFSRIARAYNRRYGEKFFYPEEIYWGAVSLFLVGHPGWLFYIIALIIVYLIIQLLYNLVLSKRGERVPLYYLWLPTAIFAIIIVNSWFPQFWWWKLLKI